MLVQWSDHTTQLVDRLNSLLTSHIMMDVTLAAEGRLIKAHKIILAAASNYFQDILSSSADNHPVIFFRSVAFSELESLIEYIYRGSTNVPGSSVQSFLSLAQSLGISGFVDHDEENKENHPNITNITVTTPLSKKSSSVPVKLDESGGVVGHHHDGSVSKKRKLFTQSLDETVSNNQQQPIYSNLSSCISDQHTRDPPPYSSPASSPVYANLQSSSNISTTDQPLYANLDQSSTQAVLDDAVFKVPFPPKITSTSSSLSCPASPLISSNQSPLTSTVSSSNTATPGLDSHFLDPDELAAKGATLLHHLAVWMIQQKSSSSSANHNTSSAAAVSDALPSPKISRSETHSTGAQPSVYHHSSQSLPIRRQQTATSSSFSHLYSRSVVRHGSESDRPDSGFDSNKEESLILKDDPESSSSPEVSEISRQAVARQPLKKKRNMPHN